MKLEKDLLNTQQENKAAPDDDELSEITFVSSAEQEEDGNFELLCCFIHW